MVTFQFGMTGFWLVVMLLMLIVEAAAPGLVSIWFAVGALFAMICASLHAPIWAQVLVFVLVTLAALVATRPLVRKYVNAKTQPTNADRILGRDCVVRETISNLQESGAIFIDGKLWTARSSDETLTIPAGSVAVVERIEGVKAIVRPKIEEV